MAIRSFKEIYDLIKSSVQSVVKTADFSEGSFDDLYAGAYSLAYQELQTLILEEFAQTLILESKTTGEILDKLARDRYQVERPEGVKALGQVTLSRSGNSDVIVIDPASTRFTVGKIQFAPRAAQTILAASDDVIISLEALEGNLEGNIPANSNWESNIDNVDIANSQPFQGGINTLNDLEFKNYLSNFISSLKDGTREGLEGTAKIVPGVGDAAMIRKLVPVGTLDSAGALETGADLFKFNVVRLVLYITGIEEQINNEVFEEVKRRVNNQLSGGEFVSFQKATPKQINWTVDLTFTSSNDALALSQKRTELKEAFVQAINDLPIGTDFVRADVEASVLSDNNWNGLFSISTSLPSGDITIAANEKAVSGTITITIQ